MYAVLTCLEQHQPRQLVWAVLICLISVGAGFAAYSRARLAKGGLRFAWLGLLGFLLGAGVWATHFMAMLAFRQQLTVVFGLDLTFLSLLVACGGFSVGAGVAAWSSRPEGRALGGALCGAAIAAMHFIGVSAMRMPAEIQWNPTLVTVSVVLGVLLAGAAFVAAGDGRRLARILCGAGVMAAAICSLHFTAMAAVTLTPAPMVYEPGLYGREGLALGLGVLAGVILLSGGAVLAMHGMGRSAALGALRDALDQAPCAIGFFDSRRELVFWNDRFAGITGQLGIELRKGVSSETIVRLASDAGVPTDLGQFRVNDGAALKQPRFEPFRAPDGRWYDLHAAPTRDGGHVAMLNDVTAQRELMAQQAEAKAFAERVSQAKSQFLANTSHEIRTPLNALLGMVQVMERHELEAEQRRRLQLVAESGRSLLGVLNSVLDLAKIEAGKFELDEHPFDLAPTVRAAVSAFEPLALQKELAFSIEIDPAADGSWLGDSDRLRQVLSNLVSNAVKFTSDGYVSVRVAVEPEGLVFSVEDSGIGVAPEKQELIFEAFEQADASTTREFGGTGLGLAICASIVRAMRGRIDLSSAPGQGSTFVLRLPMTRLERPSAAPETTAAAMEAEALPLRVLVAEDNPNNQLVLSALLEPFGVELTMTADGEAAVEAYCAGEFDAVLMDAQMPRLNGVEATLAIRRFEHEGGRLRTPIIALTANVMHHQVQEYLAAGMDGFVAKPIQLADLLTALSQVAARPTRAAA